MKLLFSARMGRPDTTTSITLLARHVSKWKFHHDAELHRLMCYVAHHNAWKLEGSLKISDEKDVELHMYPDADLALQICVDSEIREGNG